MEISKACGQKTTLRTGLLGAILGLLIGAFVAMPAQAQTFGCTPAKANAIVCENSKQGTPSSVWQIPWQMGDAGDPSIQGFATDISVDHGQTVNFKIQTNAASYHLDIYRMGYYGGKGARLITTVNPSAPLPQTQPACITDPATKLYDCGNWGVSASWAVPADAVSGIYFAKATRNDTGGFSHIVFIVRDDESHSKILFETSDEAWQAYNSYGGASLYGADTDNWDLSLRAYKVSYNRPFNTAHVSAATWVFTSEYPMVRWLEANGYDVSYFTHVDGARSPALMLDHKLFLAAGHDEYWSGPLRAGVEAARDAGVNLAFFTGNEAFWKTRWESSIDGSGTPYRTLVCYKETFASARLDPVDQAPWTGTWRDPRFSPPADGGRPENSLTGTIFAVNGAAADNDGLSIQVPAEDGKMRFWRNTSMSHLAAGQTATLPRGTLGYEWDIADDNGFRPAGLVQLSTTTQELTTSLLLDYGGTYGGGKATHHMTLYRAPSGALVFGAGSVQWSWGLENHTNPFEFATPPPNADMRQATVNLLADMGISPATLQPGLTPATQTTDTTPPVSTITAPTAGAGISRGVPIFITGTATDTGGAVGGVEVSLDGGHTWHPASGRENWAYAFAPSEVGSLTIMSRAVDDSGNIETAGPGVSVTVQGNYSISGSILPPSAGAGATVTLGGAWSSTATADANGNYAFNGLGAGNYTLTPSRPGYSFGPVSQAVTVSNASVTGVNFGTGQSSNPTHSISGTVTPLPSGSGATLTLTGAVSGSIVADASGAFTLSGVPDGSYILTPSKPSVVFTPTQIAVTVAGSDLTGIAFTAAPGGQTLFTVQTPVILGQSDSATANYELGTEFQSDTTGSITAIRFWKDAAESGRHTGRIWSSTGELLASVDFANETASGWQQQPLDEPLLISANTSYVVTVNTGNTYYVATNDELASQIVNGDLRSVVGNNGLFGAPGQFPTNSYENTNYYRDVVFSPAGDATLWGVFLSTANIIGGSSFEAWVGLNTPAPDGGAVVTLWTDNPAVTVPQTVTIPAGWDETELTVQTSGVAVDTPVTITGVYNAMQTNTVTVKAAVLSGISITPNNVVGGNSASGNITLNGPAPLSGVSVALLSEGAAAVPSSVMVPGGASSASFAISTDAVAFTTPTTIWASYYGLQSDTLTVNPAALSSISLSSSDVTGGNSLVGTVTLSGPAPASGAIVTLSSNDAVVSGILGVHSASDLPQAGSIDWADLGPDYSSIPSGSAAPVAGLPGVNATVSTATGLPLLTLTNCAMGGDCGWYGNFPDGARLLYVGGTYYGDTGWWATNGPATVQFSSPQRGVGFQAMADENGAFTATLCAYNAANTLLGCVPFQGNGSGVADGSAVFMGLYDDANEISKVTIDIGGPLYPHDFAIAKMFVSGSRRQRVPVSVTVPAGATTATFPVNTIPTSAGTTVTITANYQSAGSATLTIEPAALSSISFDTTNLPAGGSTTGKATLTGPAPAGGVVVTLSSDDAVIPGVQQVSSATDLSNDASVVWTDAGPSLTSIDSGTSMPIAGEANNSVTASTVNGLAPMILTNCPAFADCGWLGNFNPAAPLLWVGGNYDGATGDWTANGPLTLSFATPQRGVGFHIMADEYGPFSGTVCAYDATGRLIGCVPLAGDSEFLFADGTAAYAGIYDDTAEIAKITIDAGGKLYPHDFAIGNLTLSTRRRTVPASVTVPAGAVSVSFPVNADAVTATTAVTISGACGAAGAAQLNINP